MIKDIVFDFGGVIVDISRDKAVERFLEIGVDKADEILGAYKQSGILLAFEEGKLTQAQFYDELRKLAGKDIPDERIDYAWFGFLLPVLQERLDFLFQLRKHYRVYLLSNTNPIIMGWARSTKFTAAGKPLDAYFDKLYLSYEMGVTKPDPQIFELMIKDAGLIPEHTLFVDDSALNIEVGKKLGFSTYQPAEGDDYRLYFRSQQLV